MFYIKSFDKSCKETVNLLKLWWADKTGSSLSDGVMTDDGFMVFNKASDRPIAAIFLYRIIGSSSALIGFPISNPNVFPDERRPALESLVAHVEEQAKEFGYKTLVSYAGSKGAYALFDRLGYKMADEKVINYVKNLGV